MWASICRFLLWLFCCAKLLTRRTDSCFSLVRLAPSLRAWNWGKISIGNSSFGARCCPFILYYRIYLLISILKMLAKNHLKQKRQIISKWTQYFYLSLKVLKGELSCCVFRNLIFLCPVIIEFDLFPSNIKLSKLIFFCILAYLVYFFRNKSKLYIRFGLLCLAANPDWSF